VIGWPWASRRSRRPARAPRTRPIRMRRVSRPESSPPDSAVSGPKTFELTRPPSGRAQHTRSIGADSSPFRGTRALLGSADPKARIAIGLRDRRRQLGSDSADGLRGIVFGIAAGDLLE